MLEIKNPMVNDIPIKGYSISKAVKTRKKGVEKLLQPNIIINSLLRSDTMLILELFKRVKKNAL